MMDYSLRVKEHLDQDWSGWLGSVEIIHVEDGMTVLHGSSLDQAALIACSSKKTLSARENEATRQ